MIPTSGSPTEGNAPSAVSIIDRVWELRRRAETRSRWSRPALGAFVTPTFVVIARPDLLPGGLLTALVALAVVASVAVVGSVLWARRSSIRGHSGSIEAPRSPGHRWWRSPALAGPALYTLAFLGTLTGLFDHWPIVIGCAVAVGVAAAAGLVPRYETADHIHGARLENPPTLTAGAEAALADGELPPDVLELLVLQHHTGERRISWCAEVLGTDVDDIRARIRRGRRWLELPATEVHDPATADWVRLTSSGREALGYIGG